MKRKKRYEGLDFTGMTPSQKGVACFRWLLKNDPQFMAAWKYRNARGHRKDKSWKKLKR